MMCDKHNYDWEDPTTSEVRSEYRGEYDKYYTQFWDIIHNTNYIREEDEINKEQKF